MAITQEFDLNLIPSSAPVVVHVDQYDHGTGRLVASLYNGETPYSPSSASVYVQGTKPDGKFFVSSTGVTLSGNVVTADLTEVMTQVSGRTRIQFVVTEQSGRTGTFVFFLEVQASALPNDSELSQSDFSMVEEAIEMIQQSVSDAAESAQESAGSAQASSDSAEDSEAWAKGTRDGEPVESTDETYHNNAKYWAEQAAGSASHGGHTIEDENGTQMTARTYLQFENADVVDDPTNNRTVVTPRGGTGGSTIIVSTTETSLYNKNVTISDGVNTVTEQFSASGVATFAGVTLTGTLTITSTDGTSTAHATLDVPYYGSYSKAITFFSATIHVTGDNAIFVGKTVKAVKNGVVIASATFTSATSGAEADIVVGESGTYTVECQVEWRNVQSASINVSSETTYNASLSCIATTCFLVTSDVAFANADIVVTLDGEPSATETIRFVNSEATYVAVKAGTYTFTVTYQGVPYAVTQVIGDSAPITIILQRWSATLNITTASSTLYGQSISIYKGSDLVGTTAFDNSGSASFTVHSSGTYKAVCTYDGYPFSTGDIAVTQETTYSATITYFAATLAITTTSSDLYSQTITITKGGATVGTTAFSAQGSASYTVHETGTYTLDCEGYTATQAVSEQTTYNVSINAGLDLAAWITAGSTTEHPLNPSSYADFAALEADEAAVRQLMTVHDAVDYLATASAGDSLMQSVINSDICAKWINLSDYALDTLSANSDIKSVMDEADKYGYGEWAAVGKVPNMTSDTAPSGTVRYKSYLSANPWYWYAWHAFTDVVTSSTLSDNGWLPNATDIANPGAWIGYTFPNATAISKVYMHMDGAYTGDIKFVVHGSNDNFATYDTISDEITVHGSDKDIWCDCEINTYTSYRVYFTTKMANDTSSIKAVYRLQFLAYEPKGNVPIMTSKTAPYGNVIYSTTTSSATQDAYIAFSGMGSEDNRWVPTSSIGAACYLGYTFNEPVCAKKVKVRFSSGVATTFKIQGSNDGFASDINDITSDITQIADGAGETDIVLTNDNYYMSYRFYITTQTGTQSYGGQINLLQFYGRALESLIPIMTADNKPKGECVSTATSSYPAYYAFNGSNGGDSNFWNSEVANAYIGYISPEECCIKYVTMKYYSRTYSVGFKSFKVQGYDGSTWQDIKTFTNVASGQNTLFVYDVSTNDDAYTGHRIYGTENQSSANNNYAVDELQFYGFNYSEKEFATGSTRKTIYDHGVKPSGAITGGTDDGYNLTLSAVGTATVTIDKGARTYMGGKAGLHASGTNRLKCGSGYSAFTASNMPDSNGFDISSISGSVAVGIEQTASGTFDCTEIWIE